jgi:ANTAR domain
MPADDATMGGQLHDLYAQAAAAREKSQLLAGQLRSTERKAQESWQHIRDSWDRTEMIQANRRAARTDPDRLRHSAYARLQARLASMPVIEQAKGIIMARQGWSEDQAFDALRRASQRENVKVRDLAASIVAWAAQPAPSRPRSGPASTSARSDDKRTPRTGSGSYRASA